MFGRLLGWYTIYTLFGALAFEVNGVLEIRTYHQHRYVCWRVHTKVTGIVEMCNF